MGWHCPAQKPLLVATGFTLGQTTSSRFSLMMMTSINHLLLPQTPATCTPPLVLDQEQPSSVHLVDVRGLGELLNLPILENDPLHFGWSKSFCF